MRKNVINRIDIEQTNFDFKKTSNNDRRSRMKREDIIRELSPIVGSNKEAGVVLDLILDIITRALKEKEDVRLSGFGTFKVRKRRARKGVNPRTGEEITIKEKNVPMFVPAKALKEKVA